MNALLDDLVFRDLTPGSPLDDLCCAAHLAARRGAATDLLALPAVLASDAATVTYLSAPETRESLESWLASYGHDEETIAALAADARQQVLSSAWLGYQTTVMQARDSSRSATGISLRPALVEAAYDDDGNPSNPEAMAALATYDAAHPEERAAIRAKF
jgi:hypothetical protein